MDIGALIKQIGLWGLGLVAIAVGIGIMIAGIVDVYRGLQGSSKDWGTVIKGVAIGIGGALLMVLGGTGVYNLYTQLSTSVPGIGR